MYMSIIQFNQNNCPMKQMNDFNEETVHQSLLEAIDHKNRAESQLLYRKDKNKLCVYSKYPLSQDRLLMRNYITQDVQDISSLYDNIADGDVLRLFFRTSPSKKVHHDGKRNSSRVCLYDKKERMSWIERKLQDIGVNVLQDLYDNPLILENGRQIIEFKHYRAQNNQGNHKITAYDYIVTVRVNNKDLFLKGVREGIGPYKSYGCGLVLIGAA